eukprot:SAG11_NODE_203_length_12529_cov_6.036444_2_plen_90_part_00
MATHAGGTPPAVRLSAQLKQEEAAQMVGGRQYHCVGCSASQQLRQFCESVVVVAAIITLLSRRSIDLDMMQYCTLRPHSTDWCVRVRML